MQQDSATIQSEVLQERFRVKVANYKLLAEFYNPLFTESIESGTWLESELVHLVLLDHSANLEQIEAILESVSNANPRLVEDILKEFVGSAGDLDNAFQDSWAEIHAARRLITDGFSTIEKVQRANTKTPDFRAFKLLNHVIEVKNIRASDTYFGMATVALENQSLLRPSLLGRKKFYIRIDTSPFVRVDRGDEDWAEIVRFAQGVASAAASGKTTHSYEYIKTNATDDVRIRLSCTWEEASRSTISGSTPEFFPPANNPYFVADELFNLSRRMSSKVFEAYSQLKDFDKSDQYKKIIFLNWQGRSRYHMIDGFNDLVNGSVGALDSLVKSGIPNCQVILL